MKQTEKKAIESTLKLWRPRAETGSNKDETCPLCVYTNRDSKGCIPCPYFKRFGRCNNGGQLYAKWNNAETLEDCKKYAKEIVSQLEELLK